MRVIERAVPDLPDVLQFMRLLWELEHALQKASKRMADRLGVTGLQRLVLRMLGLFPGIGASDIAALLHVHPSTLTGVLSRLIEQGLIARKTAPGDRRRAVLALTPQGRRVNAIKKGTVEAGVRRALRNVSPQDRAVARRVLATVCDALDDIGGGRARTNEPSRAGSAVLTRRRSHSKRPPHLA
jgi:MarR family transcriptional regulator, organic hydroperoxide resistance regulator